MPDFPPGTLRDERDTLLAFLAFQRETLLWKADGLDHADLARTAAASTLTLGGLLKHGALVEAHWFAAVFAGGTTGPPFDDVDWDADPDWEFHSAADDEPDGLRALYRDACSRSDAIIAGADLDDVAAGSSGFAGRPTLRWILHHVISETARHCGHADLIRESIDGATGWREAPASD